MLSMVWRGGGGGGGGGMGGQYLILREAYILNLSLLLGLEPFQKFAVGEGWWSKGILEFRFGPNLGSKMNKIIKRNTSLNGTLLCFLPP